MSLKDRQDSIWEDVKLPSYDELRMDTQTEVCVVGGGITGVSVAYELAKRGHKVVLVEAMKMCSGQTSRTTAHLTNELEEEFVELLKMHDAGVVETFLRAHMTAIDHIEHIIETENIDCDFKRIDGYLFQGLNKSRSYLEKEQKAAAKVNYDLELVEKTPLLRGEYAGLVYKNQAKFHPLKYVRGLLTVLKDLGVQIFENSPIHDIKHFDGKHSQVKTHQGHAIDANYLVFATNTPINNRFHIHSKQFAYRTYAISFEMKYDVEDCLLWDTEDPYHYIRIHDGKLIVGGEDHRTGQEPNGDPFKNLEEWSRDHFSFIGKKVDQWSGQVFEPTGQIAYIGKNPGIEPNVFISTGESGVGMTSAAIASILIPDLIEKKANDWEKIFDPSRLPTSDKTEFIKENINVAYQYVDLVTPGEVKTEAEIPEDSGSLIRDGLSKKCVYHSQGDNFERRSAFCTHLGAVVHWNDIEKTWDCPAHGSRFNTKGAVIEGPAISGLSEH
jgi:glycine/D-amino acid oxidase-like deaminating enzyme/nitrite reductase/ring-hydroxylating ferredoxin subunit